MKYKKRLKLKESDNFNEKYRSLSGYYAAVQALHEAADEMERYCRGFDEAYTFGDVGIWEMFQTQVVLTQQIAWMMAEECEKKEEYSYIES